MFIEASRRTSKVYETGFQLPSLSAGDTRTRGVQIVSK